MFKFAAGGAGIAVREKFTRGPMERDVVEHSNAVSGYGRSRVKACLRADGTWLLGTLQILYVPWMAKISQQKSRSSPSMSQVSVLSTNVNPR